jgi:hypothetical protein
LGFAFRPRPDSPADEYDRAWVASWQVAWREPESIQGQRVCFQAGVSLSPKSVVFEPWTCLPLSAAAPWEPHVEDPPPGDAETEAAPDAGSSSSAE